MACQTMSTVMKSKQSVFGHLWGPMQMCLPEHGRQALTVRQFSEEPP